MHEYSIVQSLVQAVEKAVEQRSAVVHRVIVRIGELSGVDCELLDRSFEVFRAGTICERAELAIEVVPAVWRCSQCGTDLPRGSVLRCAACERPAKLASGDEIILQRIELEAA